MKSNWITIYPHDLSSPFTIYYEGFFAYRDICQATGMDSLIFITSNSIEIIHNKDGHSYWNFGGGFGYDLEPHVLKMAREKEFIDNFKLLEYNARFESILED